MLLFATGLFVGFAAVGVIMGLRSVWRDVQDRKDIMRLARLLHEGE
jgi:hypothetical protein